MNYLALAQKLRRKCRVAGTGPTAVTGVSEEYLRLLDFVNEANGLIERLHPDWLFMRASTSCVTVEGQHTYSPTADFSLTDFGSWALDYESGDSFRNYLTVTGTADEQRMGVIEYDDWRNHYLYGTNRTTYQRPLDVAVAPGGSLVVGPVPTAGYTLIGDYYKAPTLLVDADSEPNIPEAFHWAIIYRAMMLFGVSENAPEIYGEGKAEWKIIRAQLEAAQLRNITLPGPLV